MPKRDRAIIDANPPVPKPPTDRNPYIRTFTGGIFHPLNPKPSEVNLDDIAHSLAFQCRFTGHVREFYSVAEHSLRVMVDTMVTWGAKGRMADEPVIPGHELMRESLLHDAGEAYLVDLPRPIKHCGALSAEFSRIESRIDAAVADALNLTGKYTYLIKVADKSMVRAEMRDLMKQSTLEFWDLPDVVPSRQIIEPQPSSLMKSLYLNAAYCDESNWSKLLTRVIDLMHIRWTPEAPHV